MGKFFAGVFYVFVLVFCALCAPLAGANEASGSAKTRLQLSQSDLAHIGAKIYQNETNSNPEHIIAWNNGESFASLGIGHFIWFPEGLVSPFTETFPDLLAYLKNNAVEMPAWLTNQQDFPWSTKEEYIAAKDSIQMHELRSLLLSTFELQVNFIYQRMQLALPLMLQNIDSVSQRRSVREVFYALSSTNLGMYSLIDYVNFKGEGVAKSEQYQGEGWGLLQVLLTIAAQTKIDNHMLGAEALHKAFSNACSHVLTQRVTLSPQQAIEKKWLPGWRKRCGTYSQG